jgi:hypothetical protein
MTLKLQTVTVKNCSVHCYYSILRKLNSGLYICTNTHVNKVFFTGHEFRKLQCIFSKREVHTGFWWEDLREGDHLGDPGVDGRLILKCISKKWDRAWTGLSWLGIGAGGGLL